MNFLRRTYYAMPPVVRRIARRIYYFPVDLGDSFKGNRNPMVPPRGRIFIGSGDFIQIGNSIRDQLVELGGLMPHHRVLDVGCGMGRVAVPLTSYLDEKGSYEGFDIVGSAIKWCRKRISSRFPRFRFTHIELKNELYNLRTSKKARDFEFPYHNEEFDLVFLTSVFTHMVLADVDNYLQQIYRVLKPGGVCFATFFIMNEDTREFLKRSGKKMFETKLDNHYLFHARVKEANVAYDESYLTTQMIGSKGFTIEQIRYGFWPGRPKTSLNNYQDIYVFRKKY